MSECCLGEIWQCIYVIYDSLLTNQMALSFNINIFTGNKFLLQDQTNIYVSDRQEKHTFAQDSFHFQGNSAI